MPRVEFDRRFGTEQVPHDKQQVVHDFLKKKFSDYIATHPDAVHQVEPPIFDRSCRSVRRRRKSPATRTSGSPTALKIRSGCCTRKLASSATRSTQQRTLFQKLRKQTSRRDGCRMASSITTRIVQSVSSCHLKTVDSRETSDVLIPGIATCRQCHLDRGPAHEAAEARCFECHEYHDWSKAKRTRGTYTIPQLIGQ